MPVNMAELARVKAQMERNLASVLPAMTVEAGHEALEEFRLIKTGALYRSLAASSSVLADGVDVTIQANDYGFKHNFGTPSSPPRPWLQRTVDEIFKKLGVNNA